MIELRMTSDVLDLDWNNNAFNIQEFLGRSATVPTESDNEVQINNKWKPGHGLAQ